MFLSNLGFPMLTFITESSDMVKQNLVFRITAAGQSYSYLNIAKFLRYLVINDISQYFDISLNAFCKCSNWATELNIATFLTKVTQYYEKTAYWHYVDRWWYGNDCFCITIFIWVKKKLMMMCELLGSVVLAQASLQHYSTSVWCCLLHIIIILYLVILHFR